jgi:vitamin B12 transporter
MMRKVFLLPGLLLMGNDLLSSSSPPEAYLKVTKQRTPFLAGEIAITGDEIEKLGVNNIYEVLRIYNVDVYTRSEMQQDFSLNGGGFEQVKILIDGTPVNDPQTGHHNCNIPIISLKDIEYIQIVKTKNLSPYGNNAFSGVINIVPKGNVTNLLSITYGSFDTYKVNTKTNFGSSGYVSTDIAGSSGYRENTDYTLYNIFSSINHNDTRLYIGFLVKNFGAQDFYALNRKEYEETRTFFAALKKNFTCSEKLSLNFEASVRKGYDYYTTQRYKPEVYYNKHSSSLYSIKAACNWHIYRNILMQTSFDAAIKQLDSKGYSTVMPSWRGMGNFYDEEYSLSTTFIYDMHKLLLEATLKENYLTRYGFLPQYSATLNINLGLIN